MPSLELKRLWDNLLSQNIASRDRTIFVSTNLKNTFDLYHLLSETDFNEIFNKKTFTVTLKNNQAFLEKLNCSETFEEFKEVTETYDIYITKTDLKLLEKDFS